MAGHKPYGISNGFDGFIADEIFEVGWGDVTGWVGLGGALIGTKRTLPHADYQAVADQIKKYNFHGILIIGGFEAYQTCLLLSEQRINFKEFCIPICIIPATISNNVPGSEFSLGADTALNEISEICDRIRQSVSLCYFWMLYLNFYVKSI